MVRETYEAEMNDLKEELLRLSRMTENALCESIRILTERLFEEGKELIRSDEKINLQCHSIEEQCLNIIATQQPVAGDLRFLLATMQIAMELERIADYAKGIAVINSRIPSGSHIKPLIDIPRMQRRCLGTGKDSDPTGVWLLAYGVVVPILQFWTLEERGRDEFLQCDVAAAEKLPAMDVEIDLLYEQVYRELVTHVMQNPDRIADAMLLTFAAHNLERVGDRVVNICERVVYLCTGEVVDMS